MADTFSQCSRRARTTEIAKNLGCAQQTVREAIHDFNKRGLDALKAISWRPTEVHAAFDEQRVLSLSLRELLDRSRREFGRHTEYSLDAQGRRRGELRGETYERASERADHPSSTLSRLGVRWELSPSAGSRAPIHSSPKKGAPERLILLAESHPHSGLWASRTRLGFLASSGLLCVRARMPQSRYTPSSQRSEKGRSQRSYEGPLLLGALAGGA